MNYVKAELSQERCELWSCICHLGYLERCSVSTICAFHCRTLFVASVSSQIKLPSSALQLTFLPVAVFLPHLQLITAAKF